MSSSSSCRYLPEDYVERIEAILRPLGYGPEPEKPQHNGARQ